MATPIPKSHADLFTKKAFGNLATLNADGTPQVTPIWVDTEGGFIYFNSARGRRKDKNVRRDPRVAISIADPENPYRYLEIRGRVVEITEEGADEHLDKLAQRYIGRDKYPPTWRFPNEVRRLYKIEPRHMIAWEPFG